jgi:vitamin B12 transporter
MVKDIKGFNVELGGRYNHFNKYGDAVTFSFNPSYVIKNTVKLLGNITSGFKAPSLYQVYSEYRNPVIALKPEQSLSIEGGMQYNMKDINLRAVYFIRNVKDVIAFYSAGAPTYASYYVNADKQKDKGLELEAAITCKKVKFTANYTNLNGFIETKNGSKDTSFFNLYRRPRQTFNANIGVTVNKKWNVNAAVQAVSKRYEAVYAAPPVKMAAYYTLNLYSSYQCCAKAKLFCDFKNITNQKYTELRGYNSRGFNVMAGLIVTL